MSPISPERTLRNASAFLLAITLIVFSSVTVLALRYSDSTIESVSGAFMGQMSSQIRLNFDSELRLYRSEMESVASTTMRTSRAPSWRARSASPLASPRAARPWWCSRSPSSVPWRVAARASFWPWACRSRR